MNYDLPKPPDGYATDLALIISPYFDLWFAARIIKELNPQKIRFLVDDGARAKEVDRLLHECGAKDIKVALGRAAGIVHLKAYYLEYKTVSGAPHYRRQLIFGSANATKAAFGGTTNAELIAEVDLSGGENLALIDYFKSVLHAIENGGGSILSMTTQPAGHIPKICLPDFQVTPMGPAPGFDAWLQRGKLIAKYRDAQSFTRMPIDLKKPLPQGEIAEQLANHGLIPQGARNIVQYRYIGQSSDKSDIGDDVAVAQWKARYCVWTHLGDWLSEECYDSLSHLMVSKAKPRTGRYHQGIARLWTKCRMEK